MDNIIKIIPTDDDDLELLVGEEDLVCCHLTMDPIEESDDEDLSELNEISCEPIVETVKEESTSKFVYYDTEELFPARRVHIDTPTINDTQPYMDSIEPMFDEHNKHSKPTFHEEVNDEDLMTKSDISKPMFHKEVKIGFFVAIFTV